MLPRYSGGMTEPVSKFRKLSISVPPDVADRLDQEPNASAFLVDTVRNRIRVEDLKTELARRGMTPTAEGVARARATRLAVEAEWPAERRAAVREHARRAALDAAVDHPQAPAA